MSLFEENAAVLQRFASEGKDLISPRAIDFCHIFPDKISAENFAQAADAQGFAIAMYEIDIEIYTWDVKASKEIIPTCEAITEIEESLDNLARSHNGQADGWGFFTP